ncbi:MAG TPA: pantoate--beta-alanine ligase [Firmicutes bacterium]|jgi:pantoate--beta-alanine ligase|nr:pantoate--beta-alanine ligase [Bacillota bacterium]HOQ23710.1 pantoate--beta-alanine ligase [Bacillota bacterium]HPT68365.1 pantoate--beta-alanine ligase [Bacillota bacterium]
MIWVDTIAELRKIVSGWRREGLTIGLVPTMGYFHEGHLSLMRHAKAENDRVVVSLFVNPTQFGPNEDLDRYPRDHARDRSLAEGVGVDLIFAPLPGEMYPEGFQTWVEVTGLTQGLCGKSRPGHFRGVTTVVTKLMMLVGPDRAYFGEKDAQQLRVVRRMVRDLNIPVEVRPVPLVREADGLAMSSRNVYLSPEERQAALILSKALFAMRDRVQAGETDVHSLREGMESMIKAEPLVQLEYLEFVDDETLEIVERVERPVLVALAAKVGRTRLIDNLVVGRL